MFKKNPKNKLTIFPLNLKPDKRLYHIFLLHGAVIENIDFYTVFLMHLDQSGFWFCVVVVAIFYILIKYYKIFDIFSLGDTNKKDFKFRHLTLKGNSKSSVLIITTFVEHLPHPKHCSRLF